MNYILEQPDGKRRLTILIDMFIQDLASQIGQRAYVGELVERRIRFHGKPYELRFIAGGGMAGAPDRVWISCNLINDDFHLITMSVNVRRPMLDIVRDIHMKILDRADQLAFARQTQILLYRDPPRDFTEREKAIACKRYIDLGLSVERIAHMLSVSVSEVQAWLCLAEYGPH